MSRAAATGISDPRTPQVAQFVDRQPGSVVAVGQRRTPQIVDADLRYGSIREVCAVPEVAERTVADAVVGGRPQLFLDDFQCLQDAAARGPGGGGAGRHGSRSIPVRSSRTGWMVVNQPRSGRGRRRESRVPRGRAPRAGRGGTTRSRHRGDAAIAPARSPALSRRRRRRRRARFPGPWSTARPRRSAAARRVGSRRRRRRPGSGRGRDGRAADRIRRALHASTRFRPLVPAPWPTRSTRAPTSASSCRRPAESAAGRPHLLPRGCEVRQQDSPRHPVHDEVVDHEQEPPGRSGPTSHHTACIIGPTSGRAVRWRPRGQRREHR